MTMNYLDFYARRGRFGALSVKQQSYNDNVALVIMLLTGLGAFGILAYGIKNLEV
jgi:hypothetical protein